MFDAIVGNWEFAKSLAVIISFIILTGLLLLKAGSANFLRDRFWRALGGKRTFYEAETQVFHQEIREVEHFRAEFSVKVNSMEDIKLVRSWVARNSIPPSLFSSGSKYIDFKDFSNIKIPSSALGRRVTFWLFLIALGAGFSIACLAMVSTPYAVAKFKANDRWFFYAEDHFKLAFDGAKITLDDCKKDPLAVAALPEAKLYTADQLEDLCDGLGGGKRVKIFMDGTRSAQKILGWPLLFFFSLVTLSSFYYLMASVAVERIRRIIENKKLIKMFGRQAKCLDVWFKFF